MTAPTPDDQLRPGQAWLDERGDEWIVVAHTSSPLIPTGVETVNQSFRQRTAGTCRCDRPLTPPPGWSRLT